MADPILAVDLDGSLSCSDTLYEALFAFWAASPQKIFLPFGWLRHGKAGFKHRLADHSLADAKTLPLSATVIEQIETARAEGRRVILVSAADQRQVSAMAEHLGLFDEAYGSTAEINLGGSAKAAFLVERYGEKGFDYIGDALTDLPVWAKARRAITIGAGPGLRRAVDALGVEADHLGPPAKGWARWGPYLRAMRPHQWVKNVLVFVPLAGANDGTELAAALAAFVAFSLLASSVYLMNDLLDLSADREHPRKRNRPFAAAQVPLLHGLIMVPLLMLTAALVALIFATPFFLGVLTIYFIGNIAYSFILKRKLIIDVWALGGLYTARILGGGAATGIILSPWLLGFSMFLFLSLATVKRQAELVDNISRGEVQSAGRAYRTEDVTILQAMAVAAGFGAVVLFALYIDSDTVTSLFSAPQYLWLVCVMLLYWISRMVMFAHRGYMTDDPIVFALRDRGSLTAIALSALAILLARLL